MDIEQTKAGTREKLIEAGVHNLHEFGYPLCNKDNILTDAVYKTFFKSMLEDSLQNASLVQKAALSVLIVECTTREAIE